MRANRRAIIGAAGIVALGLTSSATASPESDAMKVAAERVIDEVLAQGKIDVIDELYAPDYQPQNPDDAPGRDAYKTRLGSKIDLDGYMATEIAYSIDSLAITGKNVLIRGYITGNSTGGKKIKALYFAQFQFFEGLIATDWFLRDELAMSGF